MSLSEDPRPPLPDWIEDAYHILAARLTEPETAEDPEQTPGLDRGQAIDLLCSADDLGVNPTDADHALERLLERGQIYQVGSVVRLTDSPSG